MTGYALPPLSSDALFCKLNLKNRLSHIEGDVRDYTALKQALNTAQPEIVFHLAAQALVRKAYDDPLLTLSTNMMGSANLLEAIRHLPTVRSLVYITSDKCYWNKEWVWGYRETDELGGSDPYSASKAAAELIFKSYFLSYLQHKSNFACASTRAGNVIGGGDRAIDRIVPDIIRALEANQPVVLRNPRSTRPWQHVLDPLCGYLTLAKKLYCSPTQFNGEAWNFGPLEQSIKTVDALTKGLIDSWGTGEIIVKAENNLHEATLLHLAIDKAVNHLEWTPHFDFITAVNKTAQWYKAIHNGNDPVAITRAQIADYSDYD